MFTCIIVIAVFWFVVLFLDTIFKTCLFHPYLKMLQASGLDIKPLLISLHITYFNRRINQMGRWKPMMLKIWFDVGAFITCVIIVPSVILCLMSLFQIFKSSSVDDYDTSLLLPVIPGYNFPLSHVFYIFIIMFLCSTVHEFGHALAASRERVSIEDFGIALCAVISYAFVNLHTDHLRQLSKWEQLRILCAGIWHNIILSTIALFFWCFIFLILSPVFYTGRGISVLSVHQLSGLNHPAGFETGDHIYEIGSCEVQNRESWIKCLRHLSENPCQGYCISNEKFEKLYFKNRRRCLNTSEYLTFHMQRNLESKSICLKAREVIESLSFCNQTFNCEEGFLCVFPDLPSESHRFVAIKRHHKPPVLYEGAMNELSADVDTSDFVPKLKLLPASFAESVLTFLQYIIMFSSGLAIMNVLPGFFLDGKYITEILIHLCLEKYIPSYNRRKFIINNVNRIGLIILSCMFLSTLKYIFSY